MKDEDVQTPDGSWTAPVPPARSRPDSPDITRQTSYHGGRVSGEARVQYGHYYDNRNEVHKHYYGDSNEGSSTLLSRAIPDALSLAPILRSGLEHYGKGLRLLRKRYKPERLFFRLKHAIQVEESLLLEATRSLLEYDLDQADLTNLFSELDKNAWSKANIDDNARKRLGRHYRAFVSEFDAVAQTMSSMQSALRLDADGKAPFALDRLSVNTALANSKNSFNIKPYDDMVEKIKISSERIMRLIEDDRSTSATTPHMTRMEDIDNVREQARNLFMVLTDRLSNSCSVRHRASLCMLPVATRSTIADEDAHRDRGMTVVFEHRCCTEDALRSIWRLEETEIIPLDMPQECGLHSGTEKHVRISAPKSLPSRARTKAKQGGEAGILDLCSGLAGLHDSHLECESYLGEICDIHGKRRHRVYKPASPILCRVSSLGVGLHEVLHRHSGHRLRLLERRKLALAIAHGILRLFDTPWMGRQWSKDAFTVFLRPGIPFSGHAFVAADFEQANPVATDTTIPSPNQHDRKTPLYLVPDETIFGLGIMLIELEFEQPFEELRKEETSEYGTGIADFIAAKRLAFEVSFKATPRYHGVVEKCINGVLGPPNASLLDADVQKRVFRDIVLELRAEVEWAEKHLIF